MVEASNAEDAKNKVGRKGKTAAQFEVEDALLKAMRDDREEWEKAMTEEQAAQQEEFEATLRAPASEGGDVARDAFMEGIRTDFAAVCTSGDDCLDKAMFKQFVINANQKGGAGESRETTDEWIDKAWPAFS